MIRAHRKSAVERGRRDHWRMPTRKVVQVLTDTLAWHPELQLAIVFGSVARGRERADSDVDIAVQAAKALDAQQRIQLVGDIASATGRAVDLVDPRTAGGPLLGQILECGQRLLGSDETFGALLSRHLIDDADFGPYAQRMVDERRRAWIGK